MKKAILIGNGFSSNLISNYNNKTMLDSFKVNEPLLYKEIKERYTQLHKLKFKCNTEKEFKQSLFELISQDDIPYALEQKYKDIIINSGLYHELDTPDIYGIETIMKVANLFKFENIDKIEKAATDICFNNGFNGVNGVNEASAHQHINVKKAKEFFKSFEYVFTTNYDYIFDDLYEGDVQHLHGGFDYYRLFFKRNNGKEVNRYDARKAKSYLKDKYTNNSRIVGIDSPFLIWGCNGIEKQSKTGGGFTLPISIPFVIHLSCLNDHLNKLKLMDIDELHIFGYSGQNDSHINIAIKSNLKIDKIMYYCNPNKVYDDEYKNAIIDMFVSTETTLILKSWNEIWYKIK